MKETKNQVISCRIPYNVYDEFEIKCRENQINISDILRKSVYNYLINFDLQMTTNNSQLEISDQEIEKVADDFEFGNSIAFEEGAKWYREQLKNKG
jgi:hypothetical protein